MSSTNTPVKIALGQIEPITFEVIQDKPTTLSGYGITDALTVSNGDSRYVRYNGPQSLTLSQQAQARANIGVILSDATVSSVGLNAPSNLFNVINSPITSSGNITLSFVNQTEYRVFARGLGTGPPSFQSLTEQFIPNLPISKITNLQQQLTDISNSIVPHPTQSPISIGPLSGASVISQINVNNLGHVTQISTRNITAANIGAQPAGNYELASNKSTNTALGNSNTLYPTQLAVKTYVDNTRTAIQAVAINTGTGLQGGGNLTTSRTLSVTSDVWRNANANTATGLKTIQRAGPNDGSASADVLNFIIGTDSANLYNLKIKNTQNVDAPDAEVQWFIEYTSNAGASIAKTRDMIGFARGAVTILGGRALPSTYYNTIVTQEGLNAGTPAYRYPLRQYAYGISQFEQGAIIGTNQIKVNEITSDTKLYVAGNIRTAAPGGGLEANWKLGSTNSSSNNTVTTVLRVEINGTMYDILARTV